MPTRVRTHNRTDPRTGRKVRVGQHDRKGSRLRDKKGPNPYRAGRNAKRAFHHHRRGRKGRAAILGLIALIEVIAWIALDGTALVCMLVAGILFGLSVMLAGGPR